MTANDNPQLPPGKRSGSQRRQRQHKVQIALDDAELAQIRHKAQACGLSQSSYGRAAILGNPGPRARRSPPVNAEALARTTAVLNRVGGNLNQVARVLNSGGSSITAKECHAILADVRVALTGILEIVGRKSQP